MWPRDEYIFYAIRYGVFPLVVEINSLLYLIQNHVNVASLVWRCRTNVGQHERINITITTKVDKEFDKILRLYYRSIT